MSDLDKKFEEAAAKVKKLVSRPNDEELLDIYALFKQATMCDCTQPKPGLFQLKDKAKHEAWMKLKGMSQDAAKEAYCNTVARLVDTYKISE